MKPMLPTLTFDVPKEKDWVYETKYDGFRAMILIDYNGMKMVSRNNRSLIEQFPEATIFFETIKEKLKPYFPLILDGELAILDNPYKSNFSKMQTRGRLRSEQRIQKECLKNKAYFLAFDLLKMSGKDLTSIAFLERKRELMNLFEKMDWPLVPTPHHPSFLQFIPYEQEFEKLWKNVTRYDGEGIIAKKLTSKWEEGKRTALWLKFKNWKTVHCFITAFEKENGFFHVAVNKDNQIHPIGIFKNGMKQEETKALIQIMKTNAKEENAQFIYVDPSICVALFYLEFYEDGLREPYFSQFLLNKRPVDCTYNMMMDSNLVLPIDVTHPDKPLWDKVQITKLDYITYLKEIYQYMSPFLKNRTLTTIRFPHGMFGEAFYQKNCPDYAPDFVETYLDQDINFILCNNFETLLWLGNQLAIEFHIPFQTIDKVKPTEIVIDLDPPTSKEFPWAIDAAYYIKQEIVDKLGLHAFIKVSGNRGLQIYFPLSGNTISWSEAHLFTEFIAKFLLAKDERHFTIERLIKNRDGKLYVDYVQHAEGKTIVSPFSLRGNQNAGVAAPLFWHELNDNLKPDGFTIFDVLKRVKEDGNPFENFFQVNNDAALGDVLKFLKGKV